MRNFLATLPRLLAIGVIAAVLLPVHAAERAAAAKRIPVILDTDIGDDIDDTWALGLLLNCPELEVKLVVGDYGRPQYRARLIAKLLQTWGRTDIPVGVGIEVAGVGGVESQAAWLGDYRLASYPGKVHADGVQALIDTIMQSPEPVTLIAIGPLPNVAAALKRQPKIAERAHFVGMHGSVRRGYGGSPQPAAEWNVKCDPAAAQAAFTAPWHMVITPLDTCGVVDLFGEPYVRVRDSASPVAKAIVENYRVWAAARRDLAPKNIEERSSTLYDCVAIYLAVSEDLCQMETLGIRVTDDGFTRPEPAAKKMRVATAWKDLNAFREWMVSRLAR
jgi:inosine-uridine nucleoside N-ribohydrolase